jgi:hypothetical protein
MGRIWNHCKLQTQKFRCPVNHNEPNISKNTLITSSSRRLPRHRKSNWNNLFLQLAHKVLCYGTGTLNSVEYALYTAKTTQSSHTVPTVFDSSRNSPHLLYRLLHHPRGFHAKTNFRYETARLPTIVKPECLGGELRLIVALAAKGQNQVAMKE